MKFKFIGSQTKIRLTYDRDIWFPFQSVKISSKLASNLPLSSPTPLHIKVSELFEDFKFRYEKNARFKLDEIIKFDSYRMTARNLNYLMKLTVPMAESSIDIHNCMFKIHFTKEFRWAIHFNSKKNKIYMRSSRKDSPTSITIEIRHKEFEELEFEYV